MPPPTAGRQLAPGDVEVVLACARRVDLPALLSPDPSWDRDLCVAAVVQAVLAPSRDPAPTASRRSTSRPAELRRALAWLAAGQPEIEQRLVARHLTGSAPLPLYDVRGTTDETYGVLCDHRARPLASTWHAKAAGDPAPLTTAITTMRSRLGLDELIVAGDRAAAVDLGELVELPWVGWILAVDPSLPVDLIPGEALLADRVPDGLALRIGGVARRLSGVRAALRFHEVTNPALRFPPRAPPGGADRRELIASMLAGYLGWHLTAAWGELLTDRSLTELLAALGPGADDATALREHALALLDARVGG